MSNVSKSECDKLLLDMVKDIYHEYKRCYPNADYLSISVNSQAIRIANEYYGRDEEFPIDIFEMSNEEE